MNDQGYNLSPDACVCSDCEAAYWADVHHFWEQRLERGEAKKATPRQGP